MALAGLEAAVTADPDIDFIFTSSDFLFPTIQGVLEPHGKWKKTGEDGHVILGGLDGDDGACKLIREGYVDSTGVQDVYLEAKLALDSIHGRDRQGRGAAERRQARSGLCALAGELRREGCDDLGLHGPRREEVDGRRGTGGRWRARPRGLRRGIGLVACIRGRGAGRQWRGRMRRNRRARRRSQWQRPRRRASRLLRRLLVSEYFILYLTLAYFVAMAVFFPDLVTPRNISNQLSNVWPLLAVAIGQTFVIIIMGIDLSQGAIMGFASVAGAVVMATAADPNLLGGSPLWGTLLCETGGHSRRQELFGRRRRHRHARCRRPDRPRQRLLHRPLQDAGLHGDAGIADAFLVGRHLADAVAEHRQPAGRSSRGSAPAT